MKRLFFIVLLLVLGCAAPVPDQQVPDTCQVFDLHLNNPTQTELDSLLKDFEPECVLPFKDSECMDFAGEFQKDATKRGIWCKLVLFNLNSGAHTACAFDVKDKGLVIIDPRYKAIMEVKDGKLYNNGIAVAKVIYWRIYN